MSNSNELPKRFGALAKKLLPAGAVAALLATVVFLESDSRQENERIKDAAVAFSKMGDEITKGRPSVEVRGVSYTLFDVQSKDECLLLGVKRTENDPWHPTLLGMPDQLKVCKGAAQFVPWTQSSIKPSLT